MDDSISELRASVTKACNNGDVRQLAQAQMLLGKALTMYLMENGRMDSEAIDEALSTAREAAKNASAASDSLTEAFALTSVAQLLMWLGETAEPVRCFERALVLYTRLGHDKAAATCCSGLAGLSVRTGDYSRASEAMRQAIRYSMQAGDLEAVSKHRLMLDQIHGVHKSLEGTSASPGFFGWYFEVFKKYGLFKGRASRAEFWSFTAVHLSIVFLVAFFAFELGANELSRDVYASVLGFYILGTIIPSLAVTVRRLHDSGRSGWWLMIRTVPMLGELILIVMLLQKSNDGPNSYDEPQRFS